MSIVNNNTLSYFWTKLKNYIDNFFTNYTVLTLRDDSTVDIKTPDIVYRIKYKNSTNTSIATCNDGLITVHKTGTYFVSAKFCASIGSTSVARIKHRFYKDAMIPSSVTHSITGTQQMITLAYCYGYSGAYQGTPIYDLIYLTQGDIIGFGVDKTIDSTGELHTDSYYTSATLIRVSPSNLFE